MIKQHNSPHKWLQKFPFKKQKVTNIAEGQLIVVGGQKEMIGATIIKCAEAALRTRSWFCKNPMLQQENIANLFITNFHPLLKKR